MINDVELIKTDVKGFRKIFKLKMREIQDGINKFSILFFSIPRNDFELVYYKDCINDMTREYLKWEKLYKLSSQIDRDGDSRCVEFQNQLDRVKTIPIRSIVDLLGLGGGPLKKFIKCPYHDEKTPSCSVNEGKNFCYSFCCNKSLDGIELYKVIRKLGFRDTVKELYETFF